jgi:putative nucleotidyltransferase with HDIG domain
MTPGQLVAETLTLVSFPDAAVRIVSVIEDPDSRPEEIAEALALDPALTARLLKIANSAYYSGISKIDSIPRAVTLLGRRQLRDLTIGISAIRAFEGIPIDVVSVEDFWLHSIYCGILAEEIARLGGLKNAASAFTGGLLHDIGQLLMFMQMPGEMKEILLAGAELGDDVPMATLERARLEFDHTEVGAMLAGEWGLPNSLVECISFHHQPSRATEHKELLAVVHIANSLAVLAEKDTDSFRDGTAPIEEEAWSTAGVRLEEVPDLVEYARSRFNDVRALLIPRQ